MTDEGERRKKGGAILESSVVGLLSFLSFVAAFSSWDSRDKAGFSASENRWACHEVLVLSMLILKS